MDILNYLQGMAVQHGPSGHEAEVSGWLKARFEALCDSVTIDPLYNVIALKKATAPTKDGSPAPRVMLAAHQDEIALMVADILPDGSLRMGQVGGVDPRILPASTVTVHATGAGNGTEKLLGVVGSTPPHLLSAADREHNYKREDLFVDLGLPVDKVREIMRVAQEPVSLETPIGEEEDSHLGDFIPDEDASEPSEAASFSLLKEQLMEVLDTLTPREKKVLELRFGIVDGRTRTLEEVGKEFNVTRERIRQIEAKALRKLRHPSRSKKLRDFLD